MATLSVASKANPTLLLPAVLTAAFINDRTSDHSSNIEIIYLNQESIASGKVELQTSEGLTMRDAEALTHLARLAFPGPNQGDVYPKIHDWVERSLKYTKLDYRCMQTPMQELQDRLTLRSYLVGCRLTVADIAVWGAIRGNRVAMGDIQKAGSNWSRWFTFIDQSESWMSRAVQDCLAYSRGASTTTSSAGGSYDIGHDIPAEGVVTRFPPEPSGYLHIGHVKAALLNDHFAHVKSKGKLILRFDNTNPSKESQEFEDSIKQDLALLRICPDQVTYSSDYFQQMYDLCVQMVRDGKAYADDTGKDKMNSERYDGIESACRQNSVDTNLHWLGEMVAGSEAGQSWCIRAKISIDDANKAMRDPVIYRCNPTPHHRTRDTWKAYPTYDFCAPILDSLEGITYALRTNEYRDRNPQYTWIQNALSLPTTTIWDFSRMNFKQTLLSKRKLAKLVGLGLVSGWDDPRMPTVRGMRRRGMTMEALQEWILGQGASRNIVNYDWTAIWATNKKHIDLIAPRFTAVNKEHMVRAKVEGIERPETALKPKHRKNAALGMKKVVYSGAILLDQADTSTFGVDEEITLMNWGNAVVRSIERDASNGMVSSLVLELHLEGDFKTTDKKLTWLAEYGQHLTPICMVDFDFLITKDKIEKKDNYEDFLTPVTEFRTEGWADCNVADLKEDEVIQLERIGYFRVDRPARGEEPAVLFNIPTGKTSGGFSMES